MLPLRPKRGVEARQPSPPPLNFTLTPHHLACCAVLLFWVSLQFASHSADNPLKFAFTVTSSLVLGWCLSWLPGSPAASRATLWSAVAASFALLQPLFQDSCMSFFCVYTLEAISSAPSFIGFFFSVAVFVKLWIDSRKRRSPLASSKKSKFTKVNFGARSTALRLTIFFAFTIGSMAIHRFYSHLCRPIKVLRVQPGRILPVLDSVFRDKGHKIVILKGALLGESPPNLRNEYSFTVLLYPTGK